MTQDKPIAIKIVAANRYGEPLSTLASLRGENGREKHILPLSQGIQEAFWEKGIPSARFWVYGSFSGDQRIETFSNDPKTRIHEQAHATRESWGVTNTTVSDLGLHILDESFARAMEDVNDPPILHGRKYDASVRVRLWHTDISHGISPRIPGMSETLGALSYPLQPGENEDRWPIVVHATENFGFYALMYDLLRALPRDEAYHHLKTAFQMVTEPYHLRPALVHLGRAVFDATGIEHSLSYRPTRHTGLGTRRSLSFHAEDGHDFSFRVYTTEKEHGFWVLEAMRKYSKSHSFDDGLLSAIEARTK